MKLQGANGVGLVSPHPEYRLKIARLPIHGLLLIATTIALPVAAQDTSSMHVSISVHDSIAHVVDRVTTARARFAIVSENGDAALLLMDTTIVAQMTDRGLQHMNSQGSKDSTQSTMNRIFAKMAIAAVGSLFDHGIAYNLRDLADAKYDDGRLQLTRSNGEEVFRDVEIDNTPLMESFSPEDAKAFAARARAARARLTN
ncbi:MAG: hypothetical protein ACJ8AK_16210 [Gemmatimonadaceae bacterium]